MDSHQMAFNLHPSDKSKPISALHLVAYRPGDMKAADGRRTNRRCIFLEFQNGPSVGLLLQHGWGSNGLRCKFRLTSDGNHYPSDCVFKRTFGIIGTVALNDLVEIAQRKGLQRGKVTAVKGGLRYWYAIFIQDLDRSNVIMDGKRGAYFEWSFEMFWFFHSKKESSISPIRKGNFAVQLA